MFLAKRQRETLLSLECFSLKSSKMVYVLTEKHCDFIAKLIETNLNKIGLACEIVYEMPVKGFDEGLYFVICPQSFKSLPKLFVAFQVEQLHCSNWFNAKYLRKLKKAIAIFDYSLLNINFLAKNGIAPNRLFYMPISYDKIPKPNYNEKKYDVLFYGATECQRRKDILSKIGECYKVKIINNMYGHEILEEIAKAKIVLNIHFYEDALLETTRISECLTLNSGVIISEKSKDLSANNYFTKVVDFVEVNDVEMMKKKIAYWLDNEEKIREKLYQNYLLAKQEKHSLFERGFHEFLLHSRNIDISNYEKLTNDNFVMGKANNQYL